MQFLTIGLLWLAAILPALIYIKLRRKRSAIPFPGLSSMKGLKPSRAHLIAPTLLAVAFLLLVTAAARPRLPLGEEEKKLVGVDVALALDVSGSMRAADLKPSRMEAAKTNVKKFAAEFKQGRMALVAFAGRSFTQCPLTTDGGILEGLVDQLDVGSVAIDGTAIGDAIINCINKFKEPSVSRVIILLTDGENNQGTVDPITAARAAKTKGIKIYTIGVGTPGGAPVPMDGGMGQGNFMRDPFGNLYLAKVDEATLKQIASITGGEYFRAVDEKALGEVYARIAALEKKEITIKRIKGHRELFPYFAGGGILFIIAGAVASARYRVVS